MSADLAHPGMTHDEQHTADTKRRRYAVREGIASARIEGGQVSPEAQAIMQQWAEGEIDGDTMLARVDALHETA